MLLMLDDLQLQIKNVLFYHDLLLTNQTDPPDQGIEKND